MAGIPVPSTNEGVPTGEVVMTEPEVIAAVRKAREDGKPVMLFLDELSNAPIEMQTPLFQLILERRIGQYALPEDTLIAAAGNGVDDSVAVHQLAQPLIDRMVILNYAGPTKREFQIYMTQEQFNPVVTAYLSQNPEWICERGRQMAQEHATITPTPRSWEIASDILNTADELGKTVEDAEVEAALAGVISASAVAELRTWFAEFRNLPKLSTVYETPHKAKLPETTTGKLLMAILLGRKVETDKEFSAALEYCKRLPKEVIGLFIGGVANDPKRNEAMANSEGLAALKEFAALIPTP